METNEEDYPGQTNDVRRASLIAGAVDAADRIIMSGADGSVEELDYLTTALAKAFSEKAVRASYAKLLSYDLRNRDAKGR